MGAMTTAQKPHVGLAGTGQSSRCNQELLTLDGFMLDHVDERPVQSGGRGVSASQKQVNHHLDQVLLIECGDRAVHSLVGSGRAALGLESPSTASWHLSLSLFLPTPSSPLLSLTFLFSGTRA